MERILIAEDNKSARELIRCVLESRGYQVTAACDGFQALRELYGSAPDLILLDIEMPGMNGCDVCRQVKSQAETRAIPVLMVSGLVDTGDRAKKAGADGFVQKPFRLDTLLNEVRRFLPIRGPKTETEPEAPKVGASAWLSGLDAAKLCAEAT